MLIIDNEILHIPTPTGVMWTHVFRPKDETHLYPALIMYSEIFQVTGPIRRISQFFAGHGFIVLVPEVYHESLQPGEVLEYTPEGATKGNALKSAKPVSAFDSDHDACIQYLLETPYGKAKCSGRIGSVGLCLGGGLAFRGALHPKTAATATFYATDLHKRSLGKVDEATGFADDTLLNIGEIQGEMCCLWGRQDPHIPLEGRKMIYDALQASNIKFEWLEVNGQHAFMRDEGSGGRHDPELAELCKKMALSFFQRTLSHAPAPTPTPTITTTNGGGGSGAEVVGAGGAK